MNATPAPDPTPDDPILSALAEMENELAALVRLLRALRREERREAPAVPLMRLAA